MYLQTQQHDGALTARLFITDNERTGLTYRHKIRGSICCPVVGSPIELAALAAPDGVTFLGLSASQLEQLERELRLMLKAVADSAAVRARLLMQAMVCNRQETRDA